MKKQRDILWIQSIIHKSFLLFFLFQILVFFFFIMGNFQNFADSTQVLLLKIQKVSGVLFILFTLYNIAMQIGAGIAGFRFLPGRFVFTIIGFAVGTALVVLVYFFLARITPVISQ